MINTDLRIKEKEEGKKLFIEQMSERFNTKDLNDAFILLLNIDRFKNKKNKKNIYKNIEELVNPVIFTDPKTFNKYIFKAIGISYTFYLGMKIINDDFLLENNILSIKDDEYERLCSFDG